MARPATADCGHAGAALMMSRYLLDIYSPFSGRDTREGVPEPSGDDMRSTASDALIVIALSGRGESHLTLALAPKARRSAAARSPPRRPPDHASNIASKESNQWHG